MSKSLYAVAILDTGPNETAVLDSELVSLSPEEYRKRYRHGSAIIADRLDAIDAEKLVVELERLGAKVAVLLCYSP